MVSLQSRRCRHATRTPPLRTVAAALVLCAGAAGAAIGITPAGSTVRAEANGPQLVAVTAPNAMNGQPLGAVAGSMPVQFDVVLKPRDPGALASFVTSVSTPGSAQYRQYVPKGDFGARFGAPTSAVQTVTANLESAGLRVTGLDPDGLVMHVAGDAAAAERAFHVTLFNYVMADGRRAFGPDGSPQLPAGVASAVQSVIGLDTFSPPPVSTLSKIPAETLQSDAKKVCPTSHTGSATKGYWSPTQLAKAYDMTTLVSAGDTGASTSVALWEHGPFTAGAIANYEHCYGKSTTPITAIPVDTADTSCSGAGCTEEAVADIETLVGLVPGLASVDVYEVPATPNTAQIVDGWAKIATTDIDAVVSTSVGIKENAGLAEAEQPVFEQLAAQGQSVFAATGDHGSEGTWYETTPQAPAQWDPASQPTVTAVGGTDLKSLGSPPSAQGGPPVKAPTQTAWNDRTYDGCPCGSTHIGGAGGGGLSTYWDMPSYQRVLSTPGIPGVDSSGAPCDEPGYYCRELPDVSASADGFNGYPIYYDGAWQLGSEDGHNYALGGTSLATPSWAAVIALVDSDPGCRVRVGFLNPALYELAASPTAADYLDSVTLGSAKKANNDYTGALKGKYPVTSGYNMATGLGTPVAGNLADYLCSQRWPYWGDVMAPDVPGAQFGTALPNDDNFSVIGAPGVAAGEGAAYVVNRLGAGTEAELTAPDATAGADFGAAVDGNFRGQLVVGAPYHAKGGAVYLFKATGNTTEGYTYPLAQELLPSAKGGTFGAALDDEMDDLLVVGDPGSSSVAGAVHLYQSSTGVAPYTALKTIAGPAASTDGGTFGSVVAGVGDTLVVGDPGADNDSGVVDIYTVKGKKLTKTATLSAPDAVAGYGWFGSSLDLTQQGTLIVGAPDTSSGAPAAYVYDASTPTTVTLQQELFPVSFALVQPGPGDVSVTAFQSPEGCGAYQIAIGLPTYDTNDSGEVYMFGPNGTGTGYTPTATLLDPYQGATDRFGAALTTNEGQLVAGVPGLNLDGDETSGAVTLFGRPNICP